MEIKTFRAKTMPQALALVRSELGPEALVLHTRELHAGLLGRLLLGRQYEIAAARGGPADQRVEQPKPVQRREAALPTSYEGLSTASAFHGRHAMLDEPAERFFESARAAPAGLDLGRGEFASLVEGLRHRAAAPAHALPPALFDVFTDMIEADIDERVARELLDRLRGEPHLDLASPLAVRARLASLLESELRVTGPIAAPTGAGRVVALVGPTGVGKTTTIAKLAANYRLREHRRVGLITVDTYRIAAVEQLRTYADIIDLPMEVVSTPREMREAVQRMKTFDLVLMDTAGRSPRDEVKIRELRSMLAEAAPDEVHLVLSAASSARSLAAAAEKFKPVGVTAALATKLDEATGLGNLLALARECRLPFSYVTDGQNVPDDIAVADSRRLAQMVLGIRSE